MFDLIINEETTNREVLVHILKDLKTMALDVSKLSTAVAALTSLVAAEGAAVDSLIATHTDPAAQKAVDDLTVAVDAVSAAITDKTAQVKDAVNPPPTPAPVA